MSSSDPCSMYLAKRQQKIHLAMQTQSMGLKVLGTGKGKGICKGIINFTLDSHVY